MKNVNLLLLKNSSEYRDISKLLTKMPRSPSQINQPFTADVEILKVAKNRYFAITSDSISDEISFGLYKDPYTWGWMSVMASISDMAAAGVKPEGVVLMNIWSPEISITDKKRCMLGIREALRKSKTPLLGGDSGVSHDSSVGTTIFGFTKNTRPLMRTGIQDGDIVGIIGQQTMGIGPCLGFGILLKNSALIPEHIYRPKPNPHLIAKIRKYCNASIDTSDGLAASLHHLALHNKVQFELQIEKNLFSPVALNYIERNQMSPLMLFMGDHGDYQTLVTFNESNLKKIKNICGKQLVILGRAHKFEKIKTNQKGLAVLSYNKKQYRLPIEVVQNCPRVLGAMVEFVKTVNMDLYRLFPTL